MRRDFTHAVLRRRVARSLSAENSANPVVARAKRLIFVPSWEIAFPRVRLIIKTIVVNVSRARVSRPVIPARTRVFASLISCIINQLTCRYSRESGVCGWGTYARERESKRMRAREGEGNLYGAFMPPLSILRRSRSSYSSGVGLTTLNLPQIRA